MGCVHTDGVSGDAALGSEAPELASQTAILALTGEDHSKRDHARSILSILAKAHPDLVIERRYNPAESGTRLAFRIGARSGLFRTLPFESVQRWLSHAGIEGARMIANHLQPPFTNNEGKPHIHPLTEYLLATWGEDKTVFVRFAACTNHLQTYSGDIIRCDSSIAKLA